MERRHQDDKEIVDGHRRQDEDEGRKGGELHPHGLVHFHINNRTFPYKIEGVKYKDIEEKEVRQEEPHDLQYIHQRRRQPDKRLAKPHVLRLFEQPAPHFAQHIRGQIKPAEFSS